MISGFADSIAPQIPCSRVQEDICKAKDHLLALYLETVTGSNYLTFDNKIIAEHPAGAAGILVADID